MCSHNLQSASHDLARVRVGVRLGSGLGSGLGQKFASCACTILKLRSTSCKLCRLTNHDHVDISCLVLLVSSMCCGSNRRYTVGKRPSGNNSKPHHNKLIANGKAFYR